MRLRSPERVLIFFVFLSFGAHGIVLLFPIIINHSYSSSSEISVFLYEPMKKGKPLTQNKLRKESILKKDVREIPEPQVSEEGRFMKEESGPSEIGTGSFQESEGNISFDEFYELLKKIEKNKFYPREALREMIEGDVILSFEVSENGSVKELMIEKGSGNIYLDRAAIDCVKRSEPLPYVSHRVEVLLRYRIKR